jgi:hypothetical protein
MTPTEATTVITMELVPPEGEGEDSVGNELGFDDVAITTLGGDESGEGALLSERANDAPSDGATDGTPEDGTKVGAVEGLDVAGTDSTRVMFSASVTFNPAACMSCATFARLFAMRR